MGINSINKRYMKPHNKKSRTVLSKDTDRVIQDAMTLHTLCRTPVGIHSGGYAVAHSQINKRDPLNFFVMKNGDIIINPKIVRHTKYTVNSREGCLSFPDRKPIIVQRWNKCEVEYQIISVFDTFTSDYCLSGLVTENLSGLRARIFQHEIDHTEAKYIF